MRPRKPYVLDTDTVWPRDAAHRYRLYARRGGELEVLCACPEPGGIGQAIVTLDDDLGGKLGDLGRLGVMDVQPGEPTGRWIVNPFDRTL